MSALIDASYAHYTAVTETILPRGQHSTRIGDAMLPRMRKFPKQTRSRLMVMSIKQAALELVTRQRGEQELKVIDIADTCGISTGSLYQYFNCLESILAAIYEDVILNVLSARGSEVITGSDCRALTKILSQLDQLFGQSYFEDFYGQHLRPSRCACDVALMFVKNFGCYQPTEGAEPAYWQQYLKTDVA